MNILESKKSLYDTKVHKKMDNIESSHVLPGKIIYNDPNLKTNKSDEATPISILLNNIENNFMLDSLNDQVKYNSRTEIETKIKEIESYNIKPELNTKKHCNEIYFMKTLENAINHFEKSTMIQLNTNYNYINTVTTNSTGERHEDGILEYELLKNQYNLLLNKYNELQLTNKQLMNDYAVIRSNYEELKVVN